MYIMKCYSKYFFVLTIVALLSTALSSCAQSISFSPIASNKKTPRLYISAVTDENAGFTTITHDQLGGNFDEDIVYLNLIDVNITVDGTSYPLENAIRDGLITVEEIFAYARIDARNGICTETYTSVNGLAHFTYQYPDFDLRLVYDIYEAPDGNTHLINSMGIYKPGSEVGTSYYSDETGEPLNREEWGITLSVTEVTDTNINLKCTQSGGQHIGELYILTWGIYDTEHKKDIIHNSMELVEELAKNPQKKIQQDCTSEIVLDWSENLIDLPSGTYEVYLYIIDIFDQEDVHPLMKDYTDLQSYYIPFTVP